MANEFNPRIFPNTEGFTNELSSYMDWYWDVIKYTKNFIKQNGDR